VKHFFATSKSLTNVAIAILWQALNRFRALVCSNVFVSLFISTRLEIQPVTVAIDFTL